ncbi:histidine kinase [Halobiforma lacisalsi AJ5]|uniref:Histidine kinase n=1 Tax=Natronobacterium lacisalsi AJ5 TaxID=358396 RepID=M0LWL8_NATLA|nr:sensor domain-containing protein [Halobiforma lacisalsi]APW97724.1 histidine kinase [Halobiforma lacisalsi AJ5]EMA37533.1 putative 2-component system sensor kinase [Halobiforma lacisalsi AJ5]
MATTSSDTTRSQSTDAASGGRGIAAAPVDPWTYRSLAYLLLAFPLAVLYFTVVVAGASITLGLSVTLLGPLAFVATLLLIVGLTWLDGAVTEGLLEADVSPGFPETEAGIIEFLRELVLGRATWLGAVYLLWKTLLGFVAFVGIVVGLSLAASLLVTPLYYGDHVVVAGWYEIDTFPRALAAAAGGVVVGYATLLGVNLAGRLAAVVAERLLTIDHDEE